MLLIMSFLGPGNQSGVTAVSTAISLIYFEEKRGVLQENPHTAEDFPVVLDVERLNLGGIVDV